MSSTANLDIIARQPIKIELATERGKYRSFLIGGDDRLNVLTDEHNPSILAVIPLCSNAKASILIAASLGECRLLPRYVLLSVWMGGQQPCFDYRRVRSVGSDISPNTQQLENGSIRAIDVQEHIMIAVLFTISPLGTRAAATSLSRFVPSQRLLRDAIIDCFFLLLSSAGRSYPAVIWLFLLYSLGIVYATHVAL